jgi:Cof subfamily protein (haloacid dehalogenase superfamily)
MYTILCLDYDMTLFDHGTNQIPQSAINAIDKVRDRYKIVLASGRFFNDTFNQPILELMKPDGIIHANGSVVEVDGKILYEAFFDNELLKSVICFAKDHNFTLGGLHKGNWYSSKPKEQEERWITKGNRKPIIVKDLMELADKKIYSLFLDDTREAALLIEKTFPTLRTPAMSDDIGGSDVIPCNVSKAFGMKILLDYWKQSFEDVIAIGDSMNDFELIEAASIGIAMGNAVTKLKEISDFVTTPITEDGIKNAIAYLEERI